MNGEALVDRVCTAAATQVGPVHDVVAREVDRLAPLTDGDERTRLIERAVARLDGLDALDRHLRDPLVDEVIVNRGGEVWVERSGDLTFVESMPQGAIDVVLQRVLAPIGRRLDRATPIIDARLADGSRLCAAIPPIAVDGTTVSIRRHRLRHVALSAFAAPPVVDLLRQLLARRANLLITGATSSGKTTLLGALLAETRDRCVVIEDTAELDLPTQHLVRLETRPATADGVAAVDAERLVRAALRLRPDRLVIGEFRGNEALAAVQALNTGHDGSLATCHANSALDGLRRLEGLVLQATPAWPLAAIRRQVTRSIDGVIHLERRGRRRTIAEIVEPTEGDGEPAGLVLATNDRVVETSTRSRR